jgi:uncharacterized membrane protein
MRMSTAFKVLLVWTAVLLFRLIPWRAPNVEPMLAAVMPFSKRYGILVSFGFGFLGIVLYDALTSGWGEWTWITAAAYGLLGLAAHWYFRSREATRMNFVTFSVIGTIAYDVVTGLTIGPLFHGQSFALALSGQIPFTLLHLIGAILFAAVASPLIYRYIVMQDTLELSTLWKRALARS